MSQITDEEATQNAADAYIKEQNANVITLPTTGVRTLVVDGHEFMVDFDDAALLRKLLDLNSHIAEIANTASDVDAKLASLATFAADARAVIEQAFGEGAYAILFGTTAPIIRAMSLVTQLAEKAGPVYDAMFAAYRE